MANNWLIVGTPDNWKEAFQKGNIWGFKEKQKAYWDKLESRDTVFFYAVRPVAGVVGYGTVRTKFVQTQPLWSEEIKKGKVIWPLRFEFDVEYCLPPDKMETDKVTSQLIRYHAGVRFRNLEASLAKEIREGFKPKQAEETEEGPSHRELKDKLLEIGKLQNYIAEEEYSFDLGKLDVVWRRVELSVPTYVFEVYVKGDLYHDLAKLKHAYDLWNSHIFIVTSNENRNKVEQLTSGSFHEIAGRLTFLEVAKVEELHRHKTGLRDLEKDLGILA